MEKVARQGGLIFLSVSLGVDPVALGGYDPFAKTCSLNAATLIIDAKDEELMDRRQNGERYIRGD